MLEAVYLTLDVVLASVVAALLFRFRSGAALSEATGAMQANHKRFALGATVLAGAGVLLIPGTILHGVASPASLTAITLGAYLLALTGLLFIASATWPPAHGDAPPEGPGEVAE